MAVIGRANVIGGAGIMGGYVSAGAPGGGTDEVQTITTTGTPTGGTFKLSFEGILTASIAFNSSAAALDTILEALPNIGSGGVACAGGALPTGITVTFNSQLLGRKAVPLLVLADNQMTGGTAPTVAIVETTPGVTATGRGAATGAELTDITNGKKYINTSATSLPTWVVVGTQT